MRDALTLSLFARVFLANAVVLGVVALVLLFSPIEISYPVTEDQAFLIVAGFVVSLAVNVLLVRRLVAPLSRLADTMRSVEPLEPGRRLVIPGADAEVQRSPGFQRDARAPRGRAPGERPARARRPGAGAAPDRP